MSIEWISVKERLPEAKPFTLTNMTVDGREWSTKVAAVRAITGEA